VTNLVHRVHIDWGLIESMVLAPALLVWVLAAPASLDVSAEPGVLTESAQESVSAQSTSDVPQEKAPPGEEKKPPTPPHTGVRALLKGLKDDVTHIPTQENLVLAGIGGGLALGVHPFDQTFNVRLRSHYDLVNAIFRARSTSRHLEQLALSSARMSLAERWTSPRCPISAWTCSVPRRWRR
jgi:hypothetical protein